MFDVMIMYFITSMFDGIAIFFERDVVIMQLNSI